MTFPNKKAATPAHPKRRNILRRGSIRSDNRLRVEVSFVSSAFSASCIPVFHIFNFYSQGIVPLHFPGVDPYTSLAIPISYHSILQITTSIFSRKIRFIVFFSLIFTVFLLISIDGHRESLKSTATLSPSITVTSCFFPFSF